MGAETVGDVLDLGSSLGDINHELKGVVITKIDRLTVQIEKDCCRQPSQSLVAVDQGVVGHNRMQEGSPFEPDSRVGVVSESTRHGSGNGRVQETKFPHRPDTKTTHQAKKIFERQILDCGHAEPSRSRTSPHRSLIRSVLSATFLAWPARSYRSRTARLMIS